MQRYNIPTTDELLNAGLIVHDINEDPVYYTDKKFSEIMNFLKEYDNEKGIGRIIGSIFSIEPEFIKCLRQFVEGRDNNNEYLKSSECLSLIKFTELKTEDGSLSSEISKKLRNFFQNELRVIYYLSLNNLNQDENIIASLPFTQKRYDMLLNAISSLKWINFLNDQTRRAVCKFYRNSSKIVDTFKIISTCIGEQSQSVFDILCKLEFYIEDIHKLFTAFEDCIYGEKALKNHWKNCLRSNLGIIFINISCARLIYKAFDYRTYSDIFRTHGNNYLHDRPEKWLEIAYQKPECARNACFAINAFGSALISSKISPLEMETLMASFENVVSQCQNKQLFSLTEIIDFLPKSALCSQKIIDIFMKNISYLTAIATTLIILNDGRNFAEWKLESIYTHDFNPLITSPSKALSNALPLIAKMKFGLRYSTGDFSYNFSTPQWRHISHFNDEVIEAEKIRKSARILGQMKRGGFFNNVSGNIPDETVAKIAIHSVGTSLLDPESQYTIAFSYLGGLRTK